MPYIARQKGFYVNFILLKSIIDISISASLYFKIKDQNGTLHPRKIKFKSTTSKLLTVQTFEHAIFRKQLEVNIKFKEDNNILVFISINYLLQSKPERV